MITTDYTCKVCRKPGSVTYEETGMPMIDGVLRSIAGKLSHNHCIDLKLHRELADKILAETKAKKETWAKLCPKEFQKPISFSARGSGRQLHRKIMEWKLGARGLYVHGRTGLCKTRFIWALLNRYFHQGKEISAMTHVDFRFKISGLLASEQRHASDWILYLGKVDILFLDDMGKGRSTPASEEAFHSLIDLRYKNQMPTFFTSERPVGEVCESFSDDRRDAIIRRLEEMSEAIEA